MHVEEGTCLNGLEPGQLWRLEYGYIYIVELGQKHIHYRMLRKAEQKVAVTRMAGIESLLNYLKQNEAELVASPV
jgi:hypothetical protein